MFERPEVPYQEFEEKENEANQDELS